MASTVWKGHLTFGLVSIPVRLVRAARAERLNLRQLYRPRPAQEPDSSVRAMPEKAANRPTTGKVRMAEVEREENVEAHVPLHVAPVRRTYLAANTEVETAPI